MPLTPMPPENYIVTERYLDTVLTTTNIATTLKKDSIVVTLADGKIDNSFLRAQENAIANGIPLAQSNGKIKSEWLYTTADNVISAVVVTDATGKIPNEQLHAATSAASNSIPIANVLGKIDNSWLTVSTVSSPNKIVVSNADGKIDNGFLNAVLNSTASSIPLSGSNGKIATNWLNASATSVPNNLVLMNGNGKIDDSIIGRFLPLDGGTMAGSIVIPDDNSTGISFGDDAVITDLDTAGCLGFIPLNSTYSGIALGTKDTRDVTYTLKQTAANILTASGQISATQFNGPLNGNATSATKLATTRTIALTGNTTGSASFNGTANLTINTTTSYAASAGNADSVDGHHFHWSGQGGQPTWLWGGNSSEIQYVYNPSNFSVNYATSAGYATNAGNVSNISSLSGSAQYATSGTAVSAVSGYNTTSSSGRGLKTRISYTATITPDQLTSGSLTQILSKLMSRCHYHSIDQHTTYHNDCNCTDCSDDDSRCGS